MFKIIEKKFLSENVARLIIEAPYIAKSRRAGHFIILRIDKNGERIPLTISDADAEKGTISLIVQRVGVSSHKLCAMNAGDFILDVVGPLGKATHITNVGTVVCAGGGVGVAPLLPIVQASKLAGNRVITIIAARNKDLVIVGTNNGTVHGRNADSGDPVWQYISGPDSVLSNPLVFRDRLYFGTIGEKMICLNPVTGKEIWSTPVKGSIIASSRIAGESIVVGTGKGWMLALNPKNGKTLWGYKVGNLIKATPAYDGTNLYFGAWDGNFYAVNATTGDEVWVKHMTSPHLSPATCNPGVIDGSVIVVTHDYATHCLDTKTGNELWKFPGGYDEFDWQSPLVAKCKPSYSSPAFYKGIAYLTSITGHVVGFDVKTGEQKLEVEIGEDIFDSFPLLVGNQFYFGTLRGKFVGVNLDSGKISRAYSLGPSFIFSPPGNGQDKIAIGNMGGQLACFGV